MTLRANARVAGSIFLLYIVTGLASMVISGQAISGDGTAAKLTSIAQHAFLMRVDILLSLLCAAYAVVLAVTLYALTRDQDTELAMMAMCCRLGEGVVIAVASLRSLGLLSVATMSATVTGTDAAAVNALGGLLLKMGGWTGTIAAICFAVGSMIYSYLFLRSRSIPVSLAWLGVIASILLVVALPLHLAGFIGGAIVNIIWILMLFFEVPLALWLLIKGVAVPATK